MDQSQKYLFKMAVSNSTILTGQTTNLHMEQTLPIHLQSSPSSNVIGYPSYIQNQKRQKSQDFLHIPYNQTTQNTQNDTNTLHHYHRSMPPSPQPHYDNHNPPMNMISNNHSNHNIPQQQQQIQGDSYDEKVAVKSKKQKLEDCWELKEYKDLYKQAMKVRHSVCFELLLVSTVYIISIYTSYLQDLIDKKLKIKLDLFETALKKVLIF